MRLPIGEALAGGRDSDCGGAAAVEDARATPSSGYDLQRRLRALENQVSPRFNGGLWKTDKHA
jgi:hypothetical protein